ncbi:hypothetical protein HAX54_028494 [Datura stramonium]|uniref:Uncharacterized protein n=1 Tax=Datura stramonium TaxID=4076 RepID=A0ABS8S9I6_DATST|nr:hypothetical protein [Datura stramonium]
MMIVISGSAITYDGNQLPGNFPTWLLENNTRLAGVYARDNAFIGPLKLPSSSHLHLETIDVSNNKLNGHIPANMSLVFPKLALLNMSHNFLEGPIPSKISGVHVSLLDLSHNFLSGGVPSDLAIGSPSLTYLRLSNNSNNFSGEIPRRIRDNTRLLQLDLSKNHLEGSIPAEICKLKLINVLAISENRLSGFIPSCVSSLPLEHIHLEKINWPPDTFSNLHEIESLDLSYNSLNGSIPVVLLELNSLAIFSVAYNNLSGAVLALKLNSELLTKAAEGILFFVGFIH